MSSVVKRKVSTVTKHAQFTVDASVALFRSDSQFHAEPAGVTVDLKLTRFVSKRCDPRPALEVAEFDSAPGVANVQRKIDHSANNLNRPTKLSS